MLPIQQKNPHAKRKGAWWMHRQIIARSEYRCNIMEVFQYGQRVRKPHRGQSPSSVTQLPILTALHARFPTLFPHIIHHGGKKVNTFLLISRLFSQTVRNLLHSACAIRGVSQSRACKMGSTVIQIPIYRTAQLVGAITDRPRALNERPYGSYRKVFDKWEYTKEEWQCSARS